MVDQLRPTLHPWRSNQLLQLVQHALFAALVVLGVIRALVEATSPTAVIAVAALLAGWYIAGQRFVRLEASATSVWLLGLAGLCLVAVWVSPDFAWVAFAVYVVIANTLPSRAGVVCVGAFAVGTGALLVWRWPSDGHWAGQVIGPVVGAAAAAALVGVTRFAAGETAERQRLLDELLAARDDLAVAHLQAGAVAERERLAAEIHDTLAQGFTSVLLGARRARQAADHGDLDAVRAEVVHLEDLALEGVEQARRLVRQLPPAELEGRPLPEALRILAEPGQKGRTPQVEVRVDGEPRPLSDAAELTLLRVAQEGVANARRHADADRVVVTLTYQPESASLDVADDGVGFDPAAPASGFGLAGMRSRVARVGGALLIESSRLHGTAINAVVPTLAHRDGSSA